MSKSILKKTAVVFSILAMGLLFQNCSGGGSGTGGGSGAGPNSDEASGPPPVECREDFVGIPNNSDYNTGDFCVMKFEAKAVSKTDDDDYSQHGCKTEACSDANDPLSNNDWKASSVPANKPWVMIDRAQAVKACEDSGLKLLTNDHWQTIARNIENVKENWANDEIGNTGGLNRGHSDNVPNNALAAGDDDDPCVGTGQDCTSWTDQKRTHTISNRGNNEVIWDIAGNVWEWMSDNNTTDYGGNADISELTDDANNTKTMFGPSGNYSELNSSPRGNLGRLLTGTEGGVLRGSPWYDPENAGVFTAMLLRGPSFMLPGIGFRCFYTPE